MLAARANVLVSQDIGGLGVTQNRSNWWRRGDPMPRGWNGTKRCRTTLVAQPAGSLDGAQGGASQQ
jgi:hypothetical protein